MPYIIAIVLIMVAGLVFFMRSNTDTPVTTTTPETETALPADDPAAAPAPTDETGETSTADSDSTYTDGTYTVSTTYLTPARQTYNLDITVTLADDIITDADVVYGGGAESDENAQRFEAAYRTEVVGQDLNNISLSRVGGASLTTGAFNNALAEIKAQAS